MGDIGESLTGQESQSPASSGAETIYRGFALHYRNESHSQVASDLLEGDRLYAIGLSRLAAAGNLVAVGQLADTISDAVQAEVEGRSQDAHLLWDARLGELETSWR